MFTVNPRLSPLGAYSFNGFLYWGLFEGRAYRGGLTISPVVGRIPVDVFYL